MTRLILATRNAGQDHRTTRDPADAGLDVELVGADAYPHLPDVKETGVTFAENALLKAHTLAQATGLPAVADDSGLCVDVLGGAPGIFSARWAGQARRRPGQPRSAAGPALRHRGPAPHGALRLRGRPRPARTAPNAWSRAASSAPCAAPRRARGFGYDPILQPDGEPAPAPN